MAASLVERGHALLADDLSRFDVGYGQVRIVPSSNRLKLWDDALAHLGWEGRATEIDHFRHRKFHVALPGQPPNRAQLEDGAAKLFAVYLLRRGAPAIQRLSGLEAVRQLVADATYRPGFLSEMGRLAAHWQQCRELAGAAPVYALAQPEGLLPGEQCYEMLRMHWEEQGACA